MKFSRAPMAWVLMGALGAGAVGAAVALQPAAQPAAQPGSKPAQPFVTPGLRAEHTLMKEMAGDFDVEIKVWSSPAAEAEIFATTAHREVVLGGRYLQEDIDGRSRPYPFIRTSFMGFNPDAREDPRWERINLSSAAECMMPENGQFDRTIKQWVFFGEHDIQGLHCRMRTVLRMESYQDHFMEIYLSFTGNTEETKDVKVEEFKAMEVTYARRM